MPPLVNTRKHSNNQARDTSSLSKKRKRVKPTRDSPEAASTTGAAARAEAKSSPKRQESSSRSKFSELVWPRAHRSYEPRPANLNTPSGPHQREAVKPTAAAVADLASREQLSRSFLISARRKVLSVRRSSPSRLALRRKSHGGKTAASAGNSETISEQLGTAGSKECRAITLQSIHL